MTHIRSLLAACALSAAAAFPPKAEAAAGKPFTVRLEVLPAGVTARTGVRTIAPVRASSTQLSPGRKRFLRATTPPPTVRVTFE